MAKKIYEVRGTVTIEVLKRVKANDEYEAMELAQEYFTGLEEFCGNGGTDKLIGVSEDSESVQLNGDYIEWKDAHETSDDRYDTEACPPFKYVCKLCGEEFFYENDDDFEYDNGDMLFEHLETEHEDVYALCENWSNTAIIEEYFTREDD